MNEEVLFARTDDMESALSDKVHEADEEKFLIFRSSGILYAMSTDYVMEIFTSVDITKVPMVPEYVNNFGIKNYGLSGCTILGDGSISLILDIANIYEAQN